MKAVKAILIISMLFFTLSSFKVFIPSVRGYWEIYMTDKDGIVETKRAMAMDFKPDGNLLLISLYNGETLEGKWKLKKDDHVVKITFDNKSADQ